MQVKITDFKPVESLEERQATTLHLLSEAYSIFADGLIHTIAAGPHREKCLQLLLESKFFASQAVTHPEPQASIYQ